MEFFNKSKEEDEEEEEEEENPNVVCDFFQNSQSKNHHQWVEQSPNQNQFQNHQPIMDLSLRMDSNNNGVAVAVEKEHMFDKVVTPSDVGKLNRLVIPKQHAEKYFPLDSTTNEKGLILNFEDRNGKPWRFRYSYWNSSQSYVMTKGWSRFVKDKKLDAGDVVSFHRGVGDSSSKDRLFIDWCRRRPDVLVPPRPHHPLLLLPRSLRWPNSSARHFTPLPPPPPPPPIRTHHHLGNYSNLYPNFRPSISSSSSSSLYRMGNVDGVFVNNEGSSIGVNKPGSGGRDTAAKRLRLFGVNMEYCAATGTTGDHQRPDEDLSNDAVSTTGKQPLSFNWDLL